MNAVPQSDGDGLGLNELRLVPYDPIWAQRFQRESIRLKHMPHVVAVEHIGSTFFKDVLSKPVVDIAVMVDTQPDHPDVHAAMVRLGYQHQGEFGLPGRMFYTLGEPAIIHVHIVTCGSSYWSEWLTFRDFLMHHPSWRFRYAAEKLRIVETCRGDRRKYTAMKAPFIQGVLNLAHGKKRNEEAD